MGKPKTIHQYITELVPYMDAYAKLPGRPQKLKIVGSKVYWTQGKTQELYSVPITAPTATPNSVISLPKTDETKQLTKEEEMLRERMRSRTEGMSSYEIRPSDDAVFYMEGVELCVFYPNGPRAGMAPLRIFDYMEEADRQKLASAGSVVKTCIQHVRHSVGECLHTTVGFVCNNNVFLARIHEQLEDSSKPLRVELEAITSSGTSDLQCGVADYIIQEEFRRFTGHYENERYAIIAITDSTKMRKVALLNEKEESGVETMPFPRVGDVNSTTAFIIRDHTDGSLRTLPLSAIRAHAPWAEYFPRFGFKSKDELYVTALSRTQEDYVVLSCPITALPTIKSEEQWCSEALAQVTVPEMKVEWKQQIPWAWVEVVAGLPIHFGSTHDVLVCHAAETETAHYHLFVRHAGSSHDAWKPLTMGTWNVVPSSLTIRNGRAYFLANADNRLTSVLYSVPLDASSPCDAAQLTRHSSLEEYVYSFVVADNDVCYVSSSRTEPAKIFIAQLSVAESQSTRTEIKCPAWIANATNPSSMGLISPSTYSFLGLTTTIPHIVTVKNRRGVPLSAHVFVSPMATARNAGPLAVFIYGGPHVQLVDEGNFDASCRGIVQVLLQNGISVAVVDNQMSNANGLRDFSVCKNNMGHFETHDYVDVVSYLCEAPKESGLPPQFCVDPNRVAIFGWSYGGYATLLAMCQAPNVFKIGFSGAPVGDWVLYDTGYTERYLGLLHSESEDGEKRHVREAYTSSAVAAFAKGFPEEINRVYIAHGLLDENVHFTNTMRVVEAMIQHEKPYQLLVYPGERHGLRQKVASRYHHDALLVKTLVEQL